MFVRSLAAALEKDAGFACSHATLTGDIICTGTGRGKRKDAFDQAVFEGACKVCSQSFHTCTKKLPTLPKQATLPPSQEGKYFVPSQSGKKNLHQTISAPSACEDRCLGGGGGGREGGLEGGGGFEGGTGLACRSCHAYIVIVRYVSMTYAQQAWYSITRLYCLSKAHILLSVPCLCALVLSTEVYGVY